MRKIDMCKEKPGRTHLLLLLELIHVLDGRQPKSSPTLVLSLLGLELRICEASPPPLDQQADEDDAPEGAVGEKGNEGWLTLQCDSVLSFCLLV